MPKGVVSNDISIELEIAVSYAVTAIPYLVNFEFIPPVIVFDPTKGKKQFFKIKPLEQAVPGQKLILWTKKESSCNKYKFYCSFFEFKKIKHFSKILVISFHFLVSLLRIENLK